MCVCVYVHMYFCMYVRRCLCMHTCMDGWTQGRMDEQTDGCVCMRIFICGYCSGCLQASRILAHSTCCMDYVYVLVCMFVCLSVFVRVCPCVSLLACLFPCLLICFCCLVVWFACLFVSFFVSIFLCLFACLCYFNTCFLLRSLPSHALSPFHLITRLYKFVFLLIFVEHGPDMKFLSYHIMSTAASMPQRDLAR